MGFFDYAAQYIIDFLDVFRRYPVDELVAWWFISSPHFAQINLFLCFGVSSLQAGVIYPHPPRGEGKESDCPLPPSGKELQ
jgi:hypothetical protein